jgi:hypothetical protein
MGLAGVGALIAIALALLAQSPRLLTRLNLSGSRLDLRAKAYTGYGLALLLLAMGFFLAGVPLGSGNEPAAGAAGEATSGPEDNPTDVAEIIPATTGDDINPNGPSGQTGAMVGLTTRSTQATPLSEAADVTPEPGIITGTLTTATAEAIPPPEQSATPSPTVRLTATLSPSATPSPTPPPTPTATPILVPTARIGNDTSTLPVRRTPSGPVLVVLTRGDTVIPLTGRAFHSGEVWREIQTVNGIFGWVPERFLEYPASDE